MSDPCRTIFPEYLRGLLLLALLLPLLSLGGLSPAYFSELGSITPTSARSILCEASIICSKIARVGDRQALHTHEELPVHGSSSEPEEDGLLLEDLLVLLGGMSAKLTCAVGVLMDDSTPNGGMTQELFIPIPETDSGVILFISLGGGNPCCCCCCCCSGIGRGGADRTWCCKGGGNAGTTTSCARFSAPLLIMASTVDKSSKMDSPRV